ncbi:MAG: AzlD domain-containing protein [Spirochaetes bacterium]|nr:AzlD domain-containing protein [Spirochaetota bacterium]
MRIYGTIVGMALVTFGIRYVLFASAGKVRFSSRFEALLRFIPPAVLSALIVPALLIPQGKEIVIRLDNPYLIGGIVALLVGLIWRNLFAVLGMGMGAFWLWRWISELFFR